jgi:hypothetical protein
MDHYQFRYKISFKHQGIFSFRSIGYGTLTRCASESLDAVCAKAQLRSHIGHVLLVSKWSPIYDRVSILKHSAGTTTPTCLYWMSSEYQSVVTEMRALRSIGRFKEIAVLCNGKVCVNALILQLKSVRLESRSNLAYAMRRHLAQQHPPYQSILY